LKLHDFQEKSAHEFENGQVDIAYFQRHAHSFESVCKTLKTKGLERRYFTAMCRRSGALEKHLKK
jgi:hypothetical protein